MLDVVGDSARGPEFALVRLAVDGDRIVEADAPGLARPLAGLTLLEAAAVPGETLAADALANALAQVFHAEPKQGRIAVAMSGGVDSAVALLRAGPNALGVTLRLWLDPQGPDSERACCSPDAVIAARETCHALGLPHVTLDLRDEFRRAVVKPFVRGYARGETPNPCGRCNGSFRFAELLAFARRAGADKLWTGHYARIVEHQGRRLLARAADLQKDQSYVLAAAAGAIVDEEGHELGRHEGYWRYTPGQRRGIGVAAPEPLYALRTEAATNTLVVGPRGSLACTSVDVRGRLHVDVDSAHAKLRYRSDAVPARVHPHPGGYRLELERPAYGVASGQVVALYDGDVV